MAVAAINNASSQLSAAPARVFNVSAWIDNIFRAKSTALNVTESIHMVSWATSGVFYAISIALIVAVIIAVVYIIIWVLMQE
jgi:hypothetical protein